MNKEVSEKCYQSADKIIKILEGMGYSTETKPAYENLLKDLITIEIRRFVSDIATTFYNNVALSPIEKQFPNEKTNDNSIT